MSDILNDKNITIYSDGSNDGNFYNLSNLFNKKNEKFLSEYEKKHGFYWVVKIHYIDEENIGIINNDNEYVKIKSELNEFINSNPNHEIIRITFIKKENNCIEIENYFLNEKLLN